MPNTPDRNYNVGQIMVNHTHDGGPGVPYMRVTLANASPGIELTSNSDSTGTRSLVTITNDNTAATGTTCLTIKNDATAGAHIALTGTGVLGIDASALGVADTVLKFTGTTDTTMKAPQTVGADEFLKCDIGGTAHYIPAYLVA